MGAEETADEQKRWTGIELLACAVTQLLLVNVAYRIDRQKKAPLLSTSAWAIFLGLVVRLWLSICVYRAVRTVFFRRSVRFWLTFSLLVVFTLSSVRRNALDHVQNGKRSSVKCAIKLCHRCRNAHSFVLAVFLS